MEENNVNLKLQKPRESNIELFRIFLMLIIVAHHYVVNSGFVNLYNYSVITPNMIFLQLFGFGGKMGINCFILISGYFMVLQSFKFEKFLKLFIQVKLYNIIVFISFFLIASTSYFSNGIFKELVKMIFSITFNAGQGFVSTFILFYLLTPFLAIVAKNISKFQFRFLLSVLLFYFTFKSTFIKNNWDFLSWLVVIYFIGAYLRLQSQKLINYKWKALCVFIASVFFTFASIIIIDIIPFLQGKLHIYHFINDCQKLFAVTGSVSAFIFFKNIKIPYIPLINWIAASTFGVLLIHANSDSMRKFLWQDLLQNTSFYNSSYLWLHAIGSVLGVYIICVLLDKIRIYFLEQPLFNWINKDSSKIKKLISRIDFYFNFQKKD